MPRSPIQIGSQQTHLIEAFHTLIKDCGKSKFLPTLMNFFADLAQVDHLSIFVFDHKLIPHLIEAESSSKANLAKKAGKAYEKSYSYEHDPNTTLVRAREGDCSGPMLMRLKAEDISDEHYRKEIFKRFKLLDRLSIIDNLNGRWFVTNLYRDISTGEFTEDDTETVHLVANLLSALLEKNFALMPPEVWQATTRPTTQMLVEIITSLDKLLSQREVEVCARALLGMTSTGIGLDLGIQAATVATLRKRAYAKLNISGLNELFALCLSKTVANTRSS